MMKPIVADTYSVHFNEEGYVKLNQHLKSLKPSIIFLLVDTNTHEYCLPRFLSKIETEVPIEIIEIEDGEENKTIDTCVGVWNALAELNADRKSLLINLGGGVVTDLGGFVACTFKRGLPYVNVPTTLLSMVDASVGGKTGVDLGTLKNQVGVISNGDMVLVDTEFLMTLPQLEMRSGLSEMLKHGLIKDRNYWNSCKSLQDLSPDSLNLPIRESIEIKFDVVTQDPNERGLRKMLNFGHTLGHAIESYFLKNENKLSLLHGEAIAIGMILESYLSHRLNHLSEEDLMDIVAVLNKQYDSVSFNPTDIDIIINLLKHDKKNEHGKILFALLERLGEIKLDCLVENSLILESFDFFEKVKTK